MDPVDKVEGDFFMGEPVLEEDQDGGGGKSPRELSGGGGGNSGDCEAATPPRCHFGLALIAGGDCGGISIMPSIEVEVGRVEAVEFPGN